MTEDIDIQLRIVLIGSSWENRSDLLFKYCDDKPRKSHLSNLAFDCKTKRIIVNNIRIDLKILNPTNPERYRNISSDLFTCNNGILFLYDITDMESFEKCKDWIEKQEMDAPKVKRIIVGVNCHLEIEREVSKEMLNEYCSQNNIKGIEVSSKNGINVSECFEMLVKEIIENQSKEELIKKYSGNKPVENDLSKNKKKCIII